MIVAGLTLGRSMKLVVPPATAAADSVASSPLAVRPGSRKCTWLSIMPGSNNLPAASTTVSVASAAIAPSIFAMRSPSMARSDSKLLPSLTSVAFLIMVRVGSSAALQSDLSR